MHSTGLVRDKYTTTVPKEPHTWLLSRNSNMSLMNSEPFTQFVIWLICRFNCCIDGSFDGCIVINSRRAYIQELIKPSINTERRAVPLRQLSLLCSAKDIR